MGVRLLRLEATIVASPAATEKRQQPPTEAISRDWSRPTPLPVRPGGIGSKLGEAICFIDEGAASLAGVHEAFYGIMPSQGEEAV